jgi:hypothetical protein
MLPTSASASTGRKGGLRFPDRSPGTNGAAKSQLSLYYPNTCALRRRPQLKQKHQSHQGLVGDQTYHRAKPLRPSLGWRLAGLASLRGPGWKRRRRDCKSENAIAAEVPPRSHFSIPRREWLRRQLDERLSGSNRVEKYSILISKGSRRKPKCYVTRAAF